MNLHSTSGCENCETRKNSLFCQLESAALGLLDKNKTPMRFYPGQTLFYQGNPSTGVYCLQYGLVKLEASSAEGQNHLLHVVKKGDLIGYQSLFAEAPHSATATALEETEVCFLPNELIHRLTKNNPDLAIKLIAQLASELRETETRLCHSTDNSAQSRVAEAVLFLTDHFKNRNWTRKEIGEWAGTTPETVIRTLSQFEEERLVTQKGRAITIQNRKKLMERAGLTLS